ncbi:Cyclic di-GMP phosphodiesterase PA4781 [Planktothrix tepida]|uniref:Response regulator receiver modulated diguanylate cyclase n=1 Tax=Planktothrix tepida PCC 9214 TaxID=671072 RepID=A0A1J1LP41_9CYAN|nr:diguanylate cyclase [Planktothrix tepida]CAD5981316.1 Cyclic di-GMP phosphodiesterase PA4781 [Planktothrix tepida]CUR33770.1 Response regulator receiver modulated diguanylate cyclase [Planktothrix tepida PCC 9214]
MTSLLKYPTQTNILIVDDTPDNLRLLAKILESQGYIVRKSLNGRMALQGVQRDPPNLILLDINMPEMNGYEICEKLKASESTAYIPVIFISALERLEDKVRAFELGGVDYITKPFQEQEVLARVKNQLLIQQQHQQLIEQNQRLEQEIKDRLKAEAEVRKLSLTDDLTGLYNRRGFFLLAEQQLKIARRTQTPCCVLFADLDGLKKINDTLGHELGDRVIMDAAQILKETFRDADIVARLGGDEFSLFLPGGESHSTDFQARLQANLDCFNLTSNRAYILSISMGVQPCDLNQNYSLEQWISKADKLMYEHKQMKYLQNHV